ncbi:hypothetical protein [Picosynechococcus sp. PCC 73109]|uniref:hypothetical protein n=1 Tax=Picosynechococcus sp. PCC 73109 TaxID=374982 RepID=UPI0007458DF7|nr:hypothetical protein [Picosynechococcus sp. PCC 73109]AMA09375.1 hypothetical protein AWQ23_08630 [Picosynechococcus sp. PCC 73109]
MSRFSRIIDELEELDKQSLKNTARVFAITAGLYERLRTIVEAQKDLGEPYALSGNKKIDQKLLQARYGTYDKCYQIYKQTYGITCQRGWKNLVPLVEKLPLPQTMEERVEQLENTVKVLSEAILEMTTQ